jgi:hypothetical protein
VERPGKVEHISTNARSFIVVRWSRLIGDQPEAEPEAAPEAAPLPSKAIEIEALFDAVLAGYPAVPDEQAHPSWHYWDSLSLEERALHRELNMSQQELWDVRVPEAAAFDLRLIELGMWDGEGDRRPFLPDEADDPELLRLWEADRRKVDEIGERLMARKTLEQQLRGLREDVAIEPEVFAFMRRRHGRALREAFTRKRPSPPVATGRRSVEVRPPASARSRRSVRSRRTRSAARSRDPDLPDPPAAGRLAHTPPRQSSGLVGADGSRRGASRRPAERSRRA